MILYLHGFRSSPRSTKARQLAARMKALGRGSEFMCPQLPVSPAEAAHAIDALVSRLAAEDLTVIGSSLGGYYATWIAERSACRAVLLNPAVRPDRDLTNHLGAQTVYRSDATIIVEPEFLDQLRALRVDAITRPDRYFLVAATGDEVLDWREMVAHYPNMRQRIIVGSDHGLTDFAAIIDEVMEFAGIASTQRARV